MNVRQEVKKQEATKWNAKMLKKKSDNKKEK